MSDDPDRFEARRTSFGAGVDAYDAGRPSYPTEAVAWCLGNPSQAIRVVDLGAGTGKLTSVLLDQGHSVIAVEPDLSMLERLRDNLGDHPRLSMAEGTAEAIPIEDESVDAVVSGQAMHWFDPDLAPAELARVVRPGGLGAAIWNTRDDEVRWVSELSVILGERSGGATGRGLLTGEPSFGTSFSPTENQVFRHTTDLSLDELKSLAMSRSYTITLPEADRQKMLAELEGLTLTHPDLAEGPPFSLPYRVECYRAHRL